MSFLVDNQVKNITEKYENPVYVYSEKKLLEYANNFLSFPSAYGHSVRYAMKANSNVNILKIFNNNGIKVDCSSGYEAYRAMSAGYKPKDIQVSGQELPSKLEELISMGVFFVATSLNQLEKFGKLGLGKKVGLRINPGTGNGAFTAISTGGKTSAFGIWYEYIDKIKEIEKQYNLNITKIHLHIGSENTPKSWTNSANIGLDFVLQFKNIDTLDMGGGFKMAIMPYEQSADLQSIGESVSKKFEEFYKNTGRKIHLELEPGKYMVINSCSIIASVIDILDTGKDGYKFLRTNTGMTEMPRISMYGVQQPITIINKSIEIEDYILVGHCCESGDLLTCKLYNQDIIETIKLPKASIGDTIIIDGVGAYNSSMSMKNYNSFPEAGEILIRESGEIVEIRKRQKLEDIWKNEIEVI